MEINLINLLKSLDLNDDDINDLLITCPGLEIADANRVQKNLSLVVSFGYPQLDLSTLILTNPTFLVSNPQSLEKKLMLIEGNVENKLKNNPFLI